MTNASAKPAYTISGNGSMLPIGCLIASLRSLSFLALLYRTNHLTIERNPINQQLKPLGWRLSSVCAYRILGLG
ncbi:hypothetical protein CDL15_Pgr000064 [Punica granatum]|uniref:Uncharacterized protein n=1 Tax=Punica granatum TaxID=22663 RepID=A0A218VRM6_PUNGR|nr:hypothetical protein CDL15_Pgr000064 [Punica granatum]